MYLISAHKGDVNPLRRFRPYFSMCPDDYNERTLFLLDNDPYCQIVIATVAFTNGINSKHLLDSLSLLPANTLDLILQEKGCGGWSGNTFIIEDGVTTAARGVIFLPKRMIKAVEKALAGKFDLMHAEV